MVQKTPDDTYRRRNTSDFLNEGGLSQSQQKKLLQRLQDQSKKNMIPIINQNVKRTDCEEAFSLIALVTNILLCSIIGFLFVGYYYKSYIDNIIETKQKNNEDVETYKKYIEESYTLQLINNNIQIIFGIILVIKFFFLNDNDYYTTIYEFFLYLIVNIWFTYLYVHFALRKCNIIN